MLETEDASKRTVEVRDEGNWCNARFEAQLREEPYIFEATKSSGLTFLIYSAYKTIRGVESLPIETDWHRSVELLQLLPTPAAGSRDPKHATRSGRCWQDVIEPLKDSQSPLAEPRWLFLPCRSNTR